MNIIRRNSAFSLVEVAMAMGIAAFALVAIFGLFPIGINNNGASINQTTATDIASAITSDLRSVPTVPQLAANNTLTSVSPLYNVDLRNGFPVANPYVFYVDEMGTPATPATASSASTAIKASSRYKISITLAPPAPNPANPSPPNTYVGTLVVSWPAAAANPTGSVTSFLALDRN